MRFARLRMEKRHNYVRKVAEVAVQLFITNDKPNISGLVLAGSADFKTELSQSDMFDPVSIMIAMLLLPLPLLFKYNLHKHKTLLTLFIMIVKNIDRHCAIGF